MSGGGLYSLATTGAKDVIDAATPLVLGAISGLPEDQHREIIADYYDSSREMVRANPQGHGMDYVHAYMVISKLGT